MKIGVMNDPAKPVYDEVTSFGKAGFDFVDLTIEGPAARNIDAAELRPLLDRYKRTHQQVLFPETCIRHRLIFRQRRL